jgi:hypothetical protein
MSRSSISRPICFADASARSPSASLRPFNAIVEVCLNGRLIIGHPAIEKCELILDAVHILLWATRQANLSWHECVKKGMAIILCLEPPH